MNLTDTALKLLSNRSLAYFEGIQFDSAFSRFEKKFVLTEQDLVAFLENLPEQYQLLAYQNEVIQPYHNQYFDTANYQFYLDHHRGKFPRVKVRKRTYLLSEISFWEIKLKEKAGLTLKGRMSTEEYSTLPINQLQETINKDLIEGEITPTLADTYNRIVLIGNKEDPRLTLDFNLKFNGFDQELKIDNLVILECKQTAKTLSAIEKILHQLHLSPTSFSKYCTGMALLAPDIKRNRFLPFLKEKKLV